MSAQGYETNILESLTYFFDKLLFSFWVARNKIFQVYTWDSTHNIIFDVRPKIGNIAEGFENPRCFEGLFTTFIQQNFMV